MALLGSHRTYLGDKHIAPRLSSSSSLSKYHISLDRWFQAKNERAGTHSLWKEIRVTLFRQKTWRNLRTDDIL
jgi:hypothetical protein